MDVETRYCHDEDDKWKNLLVGQSVAKVAEDILLLSNGTKLRLGGNEGCGGCSAGWYELAELNDCQNVITNVEVAAEPAGDDEDVVCRTCGKPNCWEDDHDNEGRYRIFVYAENKRVNLATFTGSDGNGYYGTGFWIDVLGEA